MARRADPFVVRATVPGALTQPLGFEARAVMVDNFSNQFCFLPDAGAFIVPGQTGRIILLDRVRVARLQFAAPPGAVQPAAIAGQTVVLTYYPVQEASEGGGAPFEPNPGVINPVLDANAADIRPLGSVASAGVVGLGADAGHRHPFNTYFDLTWPEFGGVCDGVTDDTPAWTLAIAAASPVKGIITWKGTSVCQLAGLLNGKACTLQGIGDGSVLQAKAGQAGAVLDLTGYSSPANFADRREFCNFKILGDGTAGFGKDGLAMANVAGLTIRNVSIANTGGVALNTGSCEACDFINVICNQPVGANANNIPYLQGNGACNGNRFFGVGFRSITAANAESISGVLRLVDDAVNAPSFNLFEGCWFEFQHLPTNGRLIVVAGNSNVFKATQFFDTARMAGATGTAAVIFQNPGGAAGSFGGNEWDGYVPGVQAGNAFDVGIILAQSGNSIKGVKGFQGTNVQLNAGTGRTFALLGGEESGASVAAYVDNSGLTTNVLIDATEGLFNVVKGSMKLAGVLTALGGVGLETATHWHPSATHLHAFTGTHSHPNTYGNGTTGAASAGTAHTHPYFDPSGTGGTGPPPTSGAASPGNSDNTTPNNTGNESANHTHVG